jgi:light-independent protochlorophyllide reductase subunit N
MTELDREVGRLLTPPRHPAAVPRRLLPVRGHQARPRPRRRTAERTACAACAGAELLRLGDRDDLHPRRGCLPCRDGPALPATDARELLVVGALPDVVEDQALRCLPRWASERPRPAGPPSSSAAGSARTPSSPLTQPFLGDTHAALSAAAPATSRRPSPSARKARPPGSAPSPTNSASPTRPSRRVTAAPRARARKAIAAPCRDAARQVGLLLPRQPAGNPARALPARECGMTAVEVGTPLPAPGADRPRTRPAAEGPVLSEGQDVDRQLDRARAPGPTSRLRPWPCQPAGGRGAGDQVGDRARLHPGPFLRTGGRSRRLFRPPPAPPRDAGMEAAA